MKIIAFAGSNSSQSINKKLVTYVTTFFREDIIEILDLNNYEMPLFGVDVEKIIGTPQLAIDFSKKIDSCDLLIISLAENNGAYSVAFKNIFDWVSRIPHRKVFANKPIFLMATSTGARGGSSVLEIAKNRFPRDGGNILATFSLPSFDNNFDALNGIKIVALQKELEDKIQLIKKSFEVNN